MKVIVPMIKVDISVSTKMTIRKMWRNPSGHSLGQNIISGVPNPNGSGVVAYAYACRDVGGEREYCVYA